MSFFKVCQGGGETAFLRIGARVVSELVYSTADVVCDGKTWGIRPSALSVRANIRPVQPADMTLEEPLPLVEASVLEKFDMLDELGGLPRRYFN